MITRRHLLGTAGAGAALVVAEGAVDAPSADGADLLVIGRQITGAPDPGAAAAALGAALRRFSRSAQ